MASPIPSTRWPWHVRRCANPICRWHIWTVPRARSGSWSTTATNLVAEHTRAIDRLRWHLHVLDPSWAPPARCLWRPKHLGAILERLAGIEWTVARLAPGLVERCRRFSGEIIDLDKQLTALVRPICAGQGEFPQVPPVGVE